VGFFPSQDGLARNVREPKLRHRLFTIEHELSKLLRGTSFLTLQLLVSHELSDQLSVVRVESLSSLHFYIQQSFLRCPSYKPVDNFDLNIFFALLAFRSSEYQFGICCVSAVYEF